MFKNRSVNLKFVKDAPAEDTAEARVNNITEKTLTANVYAHAAEKFVENATTTIVGGVIAVTVVRTVCVIAITVVKKFV